jgi:hypothetical protein
VILKPDMSTKMGSVAVQADSRSVSLVRAMVHMIGAAGPTISDYRWSICLVLPDVGGSVRFNMMAG